MNRIIEQAKHDPNIIWQTRKRSKYNNELEYDTIREEEKTLTEPEEPKKYIADQYEELFQARPGTQAYQEWTDTITR